jgi:hypothetical protein
MNFNMPLMLGDMLCIAKRPNYYRAQRTFRSNPKTCIVEANVFTKGSTDYLVLNQGKTSYLYSHAGGSLEDKGLDVRV